MTDDQIDLLSIEAGSITAPAGCGKTHLIAETLKRNGDAKKPILILTHTNAGVAALRGRLERDNVPSASFRLATLDGFAMRLAGIFPERSGIASGSLELTNPKRDYPAIRDAVIQLFRAGHIDDIVQATYTRLIVDEYQDCSIPQHNFVTLLSGVLPTCVLGDPMQAIFGWPGNESADWNGVVCKQFPPSGELRVPWRWKNADAEKFGLWLLDVRSTLLKGQQVDLSTSPPEVEWVHLDGTQDRVRQLRAARTKPVSKDGSVLIIGQSTSPTSQREFASQTPGAVTVESVDLRDLVEFARDLDLASDSALDHIVSFASSVMTNVAGPDLLKRVAILQKGTARKDATDVEHAALSFLVRQTHSAASNLLVAINKDAGVRVHRPAVLRAALKALQSCDGTAESFHASAIRAREQNRLVGRQLPKRAVGSTLLLKGLEAEVSVILDATNLDAKNLYVAMTRGAKKLVVCSRDKILNG